MRISHSVLDPWLTRPIKSLYRWLPMPSGLPPEAIVFTGHGLAIVGAFGFAYSTTRWWGGLLVAVGVAGNHLADCLDGTHARATGQCRNGGELLDHFFDPLSFSYWLVGLAVSCERSALGYAAVIVLFATAVLTNIKAKLLGEFTLSRFGPTELKTLLVLYGVGLAAIQRSPAVEQAGVIATWFLRTLVVFGIAQLSVQLVLAVREVNARGAPPDTKEWNEDRRDGA